jgi:acyl-CoA reductase-like NAD-dependent aldehyde dehydrogenase
MFESRRSQFIDELTLMGLQPRDAEEEVAIAIDRLVYYAGWADKYQQIFSSVNPVSSSHFSFSLLEPVGVVGICCSNGSPLVELVSLVSAAIIGGNVAVVISSEKFPLCSITFAEVLNSSDVPAGVVNILTAQHEELIPHMSGHMDINSIVLATRDQGFIKGAELNAVENLKRIIKIEVDDWKNAAAQGPYFILDTQEVKTTWHPLGV